LPKFEYTAVDAAGATIEGAIKLDTIGEVRIWLRDRSLFPVKIGEKKRALLDFEVTSEKLKKRELMHFSRQLAVFMRAGIPIIDSLETIADEAHDKVLRRVISDMVERLRGGATFADAAGAHPEAFPRLLPRRVEVGGAHGSPRRDRGSARRLPRREITARGKIVAALVYPAVVFGMSIATIGILAVVVLPQFKQLFDELDTNLPLPTKMLLFMTNFVTTLWFVPVG
jgi:type IV pilus assembly protein PilC